MILKKITYTGEDLVKMKKIYADLKRMKEAVFVGEDGNMACAATTARGALIKFRRLYRSCDIGEREVQDLLEEHVGTVPFFLNDKNPEFDTDCEWYVNWSGKESSSFSLYSYLI